MSDVYKQMLEGAGIPVTEEGMNAEWDRLNDESEVKVANDSQWSPFWRLISAIVTTPAMWVVKLLIDQILPNTFLKDAKGPWLDMLAWALDLKRKPAVATQGEIHFAKEAAGGEVTVPAGIFISTPPINGKVYRVKTRQAVPLGDGTLSELVPVEAEFPGTAYNLGPGYYSVLPEPVDGIASVVNESDWITRAGADEEKDEPLRLRCRNQFSAVGQYHHDAAYRADISLFAGIRPDYVWFEHGAPRGPGSANAYIMIDSGAPSQEVVAAVNTHIRDKGHHGHGDDLLCMPMPETAQALTVTVYYSSVLSQERKEALKAATENRIRYAFRENQDFAGITRTMPFSRFSFSRLGDELHTQLTDAQSFVFSRSDISSTMNLPVLESLTVNLEVA